MAHSALDLLRLDAPTRGERRLPKQEIAPGVLDREHDRPAALVAPGEPAEPGIIDLLLPAAAEQQADQQNNDFFIRKNIFPAI